MAGRWRSFIQRRRILGKARHLVGKRSLECGPRLAPKAIGGERRCLLDQTRTAQDAQHRDHEQVRSGEAILKIVPPVEVAA